MKTITGAALIILILFVYTNPGKSQLPESYHLVSHHKDSTIITRQASKTEPLLLAKNENSTPSNQAQDEKKDYIYYESSHFNIQIMTKKEQEQFQWKHNIPDERMTEWRKPKIWQIYGGRWELCTLFKKYEAEEISEGIYHLKFNTWQDFFWKVDRKQKQVYKVTEGKFGTKGGKEELIPYIELTEYNNHITLKTSEAFLEIGAESGNINVFWGDALILDSDSFNTEKVGLFTTIFQDNTRDKNGLANIRYKVNMLDKKLFVLKYREEKQIPTKAP